MGSACVDKDVYVCVCVVWMCCLFSKIYASSIIFIFTSFCCSERELIHCFSSLFTVHSSFFTLLTCHLVVLFIPYICKKEKEKRVNTQSNVHFGFSPFLFRVGKQGQDQNMRISDGSRSSSNNIKSRNREKTVHS